MIIREARMDDFDQLMAFYTRMNEVINRRTNKYREDLPVYPSFAMVKEAIEQHGQFIGIEDDRIVAGCIADQDCDPAYNTVHWQTDAGRDGFWILHGLRVAPEYEGRGYAKQMIAFLIELAPKRDKKAIRLDVLEGYGVDALYRKFGFRELETIEITYEDIGHPERFRVFEKVIDPA